MNPESARMPVEGADFLNIIQAIRRRWAWVLLPALMAGLIAYLLSHGQAPRYQASASMMAVRSDSGNSLINSTLVAPPPLPTGALLEALRSPDIINQILKDMDARQLDATLKTSVQDRLTREMREGRLTSLSLISRIDDQKTGVYEVQARAATPAAAVMLADLTIKNLIQWDLNRSRVYVTQARRSVEDRLKATTDRIMALSGNTSAIANAQRQALMTEQDAQARDLEQLRGLERSSIGTLSQVRRAIEPIEPVTPRPLRDAVIAMVLVGLLSMLLITVFDGLKSRTPPLKPAFVMPAQREEVNVSTPAPVHSERTTPAALSAPVGAAAARNALAGAGQQPTSLLASASEPAPIITASRVSSGLGRHAAPVDLTAVNSPVIDSTSLEQEPEAQQENMPEPVFVRTQPPATAALENSARGDHLPARDVPIAVAAKEAQNPLFEQVTEAPAEQREESLAESQVESKDAPDETQERYQATPLNGEEEELLTSARITEAVQTEITSDATEKEQVVTAMQPEKQENTRWNAEETLKGTAPRTSALPEPAPSSYMPTGKDITVRPEPDATNLTVSYQDRSGETRQVVLHREPGGTWSLKNALPPGVSVDVMTGEVMLSREQVTDPDTVQSGQMNTLLKDIFGRAP